MRTVITIALLAVSWSAQAKDTPKQGKPACTEKCTAQKLKPAPTPNTKYVVSGWKMGGW